MLECYDNYIKDEGAEAFVAKLPTVSEGTIRFHYGTWYEKNELTAAQVAAAKAKGWTVLTYNWDSELWENYAGGADGIEAVDNASADGKAAISKCYDLSGKQLPQLRRGVNIVRKADGTTQKVQVK